MPHHRVHIIELSPFGKFNLRRSLDDERNFHGWEQRLNLAEREDIIRFVEGGGGFVFRAWRILI